MDHDETRRLVAEEKRRRRLIDTFNKNARRRTDYPDTAPPEWDAVFEGFSGTSENQFLNELTAQVGLLLWHFSPCFCSHCHKSKHQS